MLSASTDAIRSAIRNVTNETAMPELFKTERGAFDSPENLLAMSENPQKVVTYQNNESEVVWGSTERFIESNLEDGKDVAIEGVAVLPKNLNSATFGYRAVFIVNLQDQTEIILQHAHENSFDWLHKYDDETIRAFCNFNKILNECYYREANKYGLQVVVNDGDFEKCTHSVVDALVGMQALTT